MLDVVLSLVMYIVGPAISLVITGILFDRFVLKKIIRNREVQETLEVFREGRELLKQILEEQKQKRET